MVLVVAKSGVLSLWQKRSHLVASEVHISEVKVLIANWANTSTCKFLDQDLLVVEEVDNKVDVHEVSHHLGLSESSWDSVKNDALAILINSIHEA